MRFIPDKGASLRCGGLSLMREKSQQIAITQNEVNRMRVKQEYLAELRENVLTIFKESGMQNEVLEYIIGKYLPKEGNISLTDMIESEYFEVFESIFEDDDSIVESKIEQAWKDVGMADFGMLFFRYQSQESIDRSDNEDRSPEEIFVFVCDDMEILFDEADAKMKEFVKRVSEIVGFNVEYSFDGYGTDEHAGEVSTVHGRGILKE
jgi:hypothetical protein